MADSFTDLLRIRQQENGSNSTTWGTLLSASLNMLEEAIAGRAAVTHDNTANYTLTTANDTTDESRNAILNIAGALTAARNTVCPTSSKVYVVKNATTGGYATTLKTTAGTGISIPNGNTTLLFCDGTNVVMGLDWLDTLTLGGALTYGGVTLTAAVTGTGKMALDTSPTFVTPLLGTPTSGTLTNCTGYPASGLSGLGTGVATALAVNVGSAGAFVTFNGAGGTPSSMTATNLSGTAASLTAGTVTTNANLTGHVTSVGNAAVLGSFTVAQLNTALSDGDVVTGGGSWASPGAAMGTGTPVAGTFTTLTATGQSILSTSDGSNNAIIRDGQAFSANTTGGRFVLSGKDSDANFNNLASFVSLAQNSLHANLALKLMRSGSATDWMTVVGATGAVTIPNLAGTGTRTVVVDANGTLSAP